jgi:hypothetical protein
MAKPPNRDGVDAQWEHTVTGYSGEKLTFTGYPPDEDDDGAVTILIEDSDGTRASIALTTREGRDEAARALMEAYRIADGEKPAAETRTEDEGNGIVRLPVSRDDLLMLAGWANAHRPVGDWEPKFLSRFMAATAKATGTATN